MKRIIFVTITIIIAALAIPQTRAFAEDSALKDIPMLDSYYFGSKKAYLYYHEGEDGDDLNTLNYCSSEKEKVLYKSSKSFKYEASISEDGKIVFFSVNNSVYRYSADSGKREKIYTVKVRNNTEKTRISLYSSPNGEYCFIDRTYYPGGTNAGSESYVTLWHDGKEVTKKDYFYKVFGVTDSGEVLVHDIGGICSFGFDSGKIETVVEIPDDEYSYDFLVYPDKGTYIMYSKDHKSIPDLLEEEMEEGELDDKKYQKFYFGKIGGEQHSLSPDGLPLNYFIDVNSENIAVYDGEYIVRINLESGKRKRIVKLSEEHLKRDYSDYIVFSEDFDAVLYVNYPKNKLVRLSGWNAKKNAYTKREEIKLSGKKEYIRYYSADLSVAVLSHAAFFESGKLVPIDADYEAIRTDRFNHLIGIVKLGFGKCRIEIINPDGSKKTVFSECDRYYATWRNRFFIFGTETVTRADEYYEEGICTDYYINEKGEAVLLWDGRNTYEIEYLD